MFAALDGQPLFDRSIWRSFPVWNGRWSIAAHVLIGDACTLHYSIGWERGSLSRTPALLALGGAGQRSGLARYEAAWRPIVEKVAASRMSAGGYDRFAEHMRMEPLELAMSYITRSGRVDDDRLRAMSPGFMALYDAQQGRRRT